MDNCFGSCSCDDRDGVTKSDLDRFTDKVENVLNDDKGRRLFRNFMRTSQMKDGRRKLDVLELIEKIINKKIDNQSESIDCLLDEAERIDELDFATMEKIFIARNSGDRDQMVEALKLLKVETTKTLRNEYNKFSKYYTPSK